MILSQSTSEARKNFLKQQASYLAQLKKRLSEKKITEKYYSDQLWLTNQDLDSAETAYVNTLALELAKSATVNLPETLGNAGGYVAKGAGAIANAAGNVAGSALQGVGKGIFGSVGLAGSGIAFIAIAIWLFGFGPLSQFKIGKK